MSIPRITGRQARDLLDGTTPGPWEVEDRSPNMGGRSFVIRQAEVPGIRVQGITYGFNNNPELLAAAPALAETIAWLYGAEGQDGHYGKRRWPLGTSWEVALWRGLISIGPEGGGIAFRTPELAEEAARALLAAAEEARS